MEKASPISKYFVTAERETDGCGGKCLAIREKQCYTERNSLRYREVTAQSIQRMQILHRGIFMPAFDRILQLARMEEMDCEFVEVTARECPPHPCGVAGRVYHRGGAVVHDGERYEDFEAATGYGTGPGLCGWNCRHNFYPFYPAYLSAITRMNAWPGWMPAIFPTAAGCSQGIQTPGKPLV